MIQQNDCPRCSGGRIGRHGADDVAMLLHDLRNALTAVRGFAEAAAKRLPADSAALADVQAAQAAADRAAALVAEPQKVDRPVTDACASAEEEMQALRREAPSHVRLRVRGSARCPHAAVPPADFRRLLHNLCTNAFQALAEGEAGTVVVAVEPCEAPGEADDLPLLAPGRYVRLVVEDDGPGIPPALLGRLFEAGASSRLDDGGHGLGLWSVRQLARRAGGGVQVRRGRMGGARFEVYFPAAGPSGG